MKPELFARIADKASAGVTVGISVASCEEQAVLEQILLVVGKSLDLSDVYTYDLGLGLRKLAYSKGVGVTLIPHGLSWEKGSPVDMVKFIRDYQGRGLFILIDCQKILAELPMLRAVKVCTDQLASNPDASTFRRLMFLGENIQFDNELDGRAEVVRIGRPTEEEILAEVRLQLMQFNRSVDDFTAPPETDKAFWTRFVRASSALHRRELVNVMRESVATMGVIGEDTIAALQAYKVEKLKLMGVEVAQEPKTGMGGYDELQAYLRQQALLMQPEEGDADEDPPKGILVAGPSGTGKSLVAKLTGQILGMPVFAFKMSSILDKFVGGSESKLKAILEMAEAAAPVVLWVDEIEKAFAGVSGDSHDSGVGRRVFGQFLTWMQEKTALVYIVATANSVVDLPPELLRAGRFDELWRVDLPTLAERQKILAIHLARYATKTPQPVITTMLEQLPSVTDKFSGAELEGIVVQAKNLARLRGERGVLKLDELLSLAKQTKPLAVKKAIDLERMRESWQDFRPASSGEAVPAVSMGRSGAMAPRSTTIKFNSRTTK